MNRHDWRSKSEEFELVGYKNWKDFLFAPQERDSSIPMWDKPLGHLEPELLRMLFDLNNRLVKAEEKIKELEEARS